MRAARRGRHAADGIDALNAAEGSLDIGGWCFTILAAGLLQPGFEVGLDDAIPQRPLGTAAYSAAPKFRSSDILISGEFCCAGGAGRQMIDWLVAECRAQGRPRLYWATKENNYRARGLYDKYTPHSGFPRYVVNIPA